jgi:hypothetical protein
MAITPLRRAALPTLLTMLCLHAPVQGQPTAQLRVTATVLPYVVVRMVSHPTQVEVTKEDVARGYLEAVPVGVQIRSNTREAYGLTFERHGEHFSSASVEGLGARLNVVSRSAITWRPDSLDNALDFRVRLRLAPDLAPGRYPWPLQFSLAPA